MDVSTRFEHHMGQHVGCIGSFGIHPADGNVVIGPESGSAFCSLAAQHIYSVIESDEQPLQQDLCRF